MRKYQQQQLLGLVHTLDEANAEIKHLIARGDLSDLIQLLADCQNVAVQMGEFIEAIEGEGTETVALLEEYCDDLYKVSVEINDGNTNSNFAKCLRNRIVEIENSIKSEQKPDRIEVVFFPYKASMWDSLESIWLAAKDDPQCDAYVVPIPYYEKHPNGAFGQLHYEGNLYPDYVSVTDWRSYDLEARHPDVVFIHNPYDSNNYVTSVHPSFYSDKLKKSTDMLCYVPYYVVANDVREQFCILPGVVNSDKVFVQSDQIRDSYIGFFKNVYGNRFGTPEDRFYAFGSPKFDKVNNSKPENYELPYEWKNLIENLDGGRKKIVLYNTTVGSLLQGNEQYLKKIKSVLDAFRRRDDVVLWWRPHPLIETTYKAMRPQLYQIFKDIADEYKSSGFGIYDDTPELHRALTWSDAYYGDGSSLVALCQNAGKPVVLQNSNFYNADNFTFPVGFYDDGEYLWFSSQAINCLFKLSKATFELCFVGVFPEEDAYSPLLYKDVVEKDGKLYFAPCDARDMAVYDIATGEFEKVNLKLEIKCGVKPDFHKFRSAIAYGSKIFCIPGGYSAIVSYDTDTGEIAAYPFWDGLLEKLTFSSEAFRFIEATVFENRLILPSAEANAFVDFNMNTGNLAVVKLGKAKQSYRGATVYNDKCCFAPWRDGGAIIYKFEDNLPYTVKGLPNTSYGYFPAVNYKNELYFFPVKGDEIYVINTDTGETSLEKEFSHFCGESNPDSFWYSMGLRLMFAKMVGEHIYAYNRQSGKMIVYDPAQHKVLRAEKLFMSEENRQIIDSLCRSAFSDYLSRGEDVLREGPLKPLAYLLDWIVSDFRESSATAYDTGDEPAGEAIFRYVRGEAFGTKQGFKD